MAEKELRSKRFTVLGCEFNGTPNDFASHYQKWFHGLDNYPESWNPREARQDDILAVMGTLALYHLGYSVPVDPQTFMKQGVDVTVDYFCADWWHLHKGASREMDKTRKRRDLMWFKAFSKGLLLGLLSRRWDDVASICAWVEVDLRPEYMGDDLEIELVHVYKSVAAGLRPEPMPGLEKLEAAIRKCRTLQPRLLFQAWDAARQKDQPAFDQAFVKSLEHFSKNFGSGPSPLHWIAPHHSVVGLAARRLGMTLPDLPPKLEAVVITPESLGFAPAS